MLNTNKLRKMRKDGLLNNNCDCMACEMTRLNPPAVPRWVSVLAVAGFIGLVLGLIAFYGCAPASASQSRVEASSVVSGQLVNLGIIATIESDYNPSAYNKSSHAVGLYQITAVCLEDFNHYHKRNPVSGGSGQYTLLDMYDVQKAYIVAEFYFDYRIPQLLKHYRLADTVRNRLVCWNAGIGVLIRNERKHKRLPRETVEYIRKYNHLERNWK